MKLVITLILSLLCSAVCTGQTVKDIFQGEITGVSPFILCLEAESGIVKGFYKYLPEGLVVPLSGVLDSKGEITLECVGKKYPVFSGNLRNQIVKGNCSLSENTKPHEFYAVDLRGEYMNYNYDCIRFELSDKGYLAKDMKSSQQSLITTSVENNGRIYLQCDSLNARLYLNKDTLMVDTIKYWPLFIAKRDFEGSADLLKFSLRKEFWNGESFVEFPEKNEDYNTAAKEIKLNDNYSATLRQIPRSEYIIRKWESPHQQHPPYKAVTDSCKAKEMLRKQVKEIEVQEDGYTRPALEITFKDGIKKKLDWFKWDYSFIAYYPEVSILVLNDEAGGDYSLDLNDSINERVGNPRYYAIAPDKELRIAGLYPGGAADGMEYFLEAWNASKRKYEYVESLSFPYSEGWFWRNNSKVLFIDNSGGSDYCYEMEIIKK